MIGDPKLGLQRFYEDRYGEGVEIIEVISASAGARRANLIFTLRRDGADERFVATVMPEGQIQLNSIEVEAAVRRLVRSHGVRVPEVAEVSTDASYLGGPFFVSAFVEGVTIPRHILRLAESQGIGGQIVEDIGSSLALLHRIDPAAAPDGLLGDRPHDPGRAAIEEARGVIEAMSPVRPALVWALEWMEANLPAHTASCMVHTDVRNGNIMVSERGLEAILDWEGTRKFGDPMQDLAWTAVRSWRFRNDSLEIGGLAGRDSLRRGYEAAGGEFDEERFNWWKVAMTMWWALGLHGQAMAHIDGQFSHIVMAASGRRVPELEWDLLMLTRPT
jgi:aminoglycoside phosphotransferase (APT) family kinase protein